MRKIVILGSGGSGKSTLARQLGRILNLEVIHLDGLYWQPGWVETPEPAWRQTVTELIQRKSWIMDGDNIRSLDIRLPAADTVIFLDLPNVLCFWRALKRSWQYAGKNRPEMVSGCSEKLDWRFLRWVWQYPLVSRPFILDKLRQLSRDQRLIILRSPAAVQQFLQELSSIQKGSQNE
jgi:adenylate kinase family enzyme